MSLLYVLTYDVRAKNHDYTRLYELLNSWKAAHLQDSVWLADMNGGAEAVRDAMRAHMHPDDTVCVVQLPASGANWAAINARPDGVQWLKTHFP
jgi:CRISPR/Cas system-associated endoribonuclease Cas2